MDLLRGTTTTLILGFPFTLRVDITRSSSCIIGMRYQYRTICSGILSDRDDGTGVALVLVKQLEEDGQAQLK